MWRDRRDSSGWWAGGIFRIISVEGVKMEYAEGFGQRSAEENNARRGEPHLVDVLWGKHISIGSLSQLVDLISFSLEYFQGKYR